MKFIKRAEFILPSSLLSLGLLWIFLENEVHVSNNLASAVLALPKSYKDLFFLVAVSITLFIILRSHRITSAKVIARLKMHEQKIESQNKQLKNFAFQTSHLARAPLANILGLAAVINANGCKNDTNEELLGLLEISAKQLDNVIKDIVLQIS